MRGNGLHGTVGSAPAEQEEVEWVALHTQDHSTWLHAAVQSLAVEGPWLALGCPMGLLTL